MSMKPFFLPLLTLFMFQGGAAMADMSAKAYFAGGCFWCLEASFESVKGVGDSISGYMMLPDGKKPTEVLEVHYDPKVVNYDKLLEIFWLNIDPDDQDGQFYDRGDGYRTAIFYQTDAEKRAAEQSKANAEAELGRPLAPLILPAASFERAAESHQNFYKTNELHYQSYKYGSGRPDKLKKIWGDKAGH